MRRKLIKISPSTTVVSVPSQWVKKNKLEKGDSIELQELENTLHISTAQKTHKHAITVDLRPFGEKLCYAQADATYIAGYNDITFLIKGKEQQEIMAFVAPEFPGMIMAEQTPTKVRFKDITGNTPEDIDSLMNRILNFVISMCDDATAASAEGNWEMLHAMKRRDHVLNSYISYGLRLMNKHGYSSFSKTGLVMTYLKIIEMLCDELCVMLKKCAKHKIKATTLLQQLTEIFRHVQRTHAKYDGQRIIQLDTMRKQLKAPKKEIADDVSSIASLLFDLIEVEIQYQT